jgi:transposase-like protein
MGKQRKHYSGAEKMAILREHLIEQVPISEVCEKHGLQPAVFYTWQKRLFEGGAAVFEDRRTARRQPDGSAQRIEALQAKLARKDEVLAELMEEHVALKKSLGEI